MTTEPTFDECDSTSLYCNITSNVYITIAGLTLSEGTQYFICIRGASKNNAAFGESVMLNCSDGIIIDTNAPTGGTVTIGHTNTATVGYQSDNDVLVLNWLGFADVEQVSVINRIGIEDYKCGLGRFKYRKRGRTLRIYGRFGRFQESGGGGSALNFVLRLWAILNPGETRTPSPLGYSTFKYRDVTQNNTCTNKINIH